MQHVYEVALWVGPEHVDALAGFLYHLRDLASQERDGAVVVWVGEAEAAEHLVAAAGARFPIRASAITAVPVTWGDAAASAPTPLGAGFAVCAPGAAPPAGRRAIRIEPGLGFGHGAHPTTQLTAAAIERVFEASPAPTTALDAGTGSGVLGLLAACLGATRVVGFDVDDAAVAAARRNAAATGVAHFEATSEAPTEGAFDLVIANIHAGPLLALAPTLGPRVGGTLILSGLRARTAPPVLAAYAAFGLRVVHRDEQDGWLGLTLRR